MSKNTSISLGGYFESFINQQIENGRFASASEAIRAGLHLLIQEDLKLEALRHSLKAGEKSGRADYSLNSLMEELDNE